MYKLSKVKIAVLLLLSLGIAAHEFAQVKQINDSVKYSYTHISESNNAIPRVFRPPYFDNKGILWMATQSGICSFDGTSIKRYRDSTGKSLIVYSFAEIGQDSILVAAKDGLSLITKGLIKGLTLPDSVQGVFGIAKTKNLIALNSRYGVVLLQNNKLFLLKATKGWIISSIIANRISGEIFFYSDKGIYKYFKGLLSKLINPATQSGILYIDSKSNLYYTDTSLNIYADGRIKNIYTVKKRVTSILENEEGIYLTDNGHLYLRRPGESFFSGVAPMLENSFNGGLIAILKNPHDGNLWLVTNYGLYVRQRRLFTTEQYENNLISFEKGWDAVTRTVMNVNGELIVKEDEHQYSFNKKFKPVNPMFKNAEEEPAFTDITYLSQSEAYMVFQKWMYTYCKDNRAYDVPISDSLNIIMSDIYNIHSRNQVWIQTTSGPLLCQGTEYVLYSKRNGYNLKSNNITKIFPDPVMNWVWTGSSDGDFACLDVATGRYIYVDSIWGLRKNTKELFVTVSIAASAKDVWVYLVNKGLYRIQRIGNDPTKFRCKLWDENAPLGRYCLDGRGNLWCFGENLIRIYKADILGNVRSPEVFQEIDPMKELNVNSHFDNFFYFQPNQTGNEFCFYNSRTRYTFKVNELFRKDTLCYNVVISNLLLNREPVKWGTLGYILDNNQLPVQPVFKYYQNNIGFEYSTLARLLNKSLLYRYKLSGYDQYWQPATNDQKAIYNNLGPGEYSFEVQYSYDGLSWSKSTGYAFRILPPWWSAWWFRISILLILASMIYTYILYKIFKLEKQRKQLEREVQKRTLQLENSISLLETSNRQNELLISVLVHDIKGPARFIADVSQNLEEMWDILKEKEKKEIAGEIMNATKALFRFLTGFLSWIKLKKEIILGKEDISLRELFERIITYHKETGNCVTNHQVNALTDDIIIHTSKRYLEIIISNLVENACKNTDNGVITLSAYKMGDTTNITCTDTGKGMSREQIKSLLTSAGGEMSNDNNSFRMGYVFIMDIVKKLEIEIRIDSEIGKGTVVTLIHNNNERG